MTVEETIASAQRAHRAHWQASSDESTGDKAASQVTRTWQDEVTSLHPKRFVAEYAVAVGLRERIDLVDTERRVAFDLKDSPNNTHFELYRDIFKIWLHNERNAPPIQELVFITPEAGAMKVRRNFGAAVVELMAKHSLSVRIAGI
jgi:hypothetical protein